MPSFRTTKTSKNSADKENHPERPCRKESPNGRGTRMKQKERACCLANKGNQGPSSPEGPLSSITATHKGHWHGSDPQQGLSGVFTNKCTAEFMGAATPEQPEREGCSCNLGYYGYYACRQRENHLWSRGLQSKSLRRLEFLNEAR